MNDDRFSDPRYIQTLFNEMASEYDDIRDLWYPFLFDSLDRIIVQNFSRLAPGTKVLDVGCGTGKQSLTFAKLGAQVTGLDIADRLLRVAEQNLTSFAERFDLVAADATQIPFADGTFDVVNCCGSTLSFVADYRQAIREMSRVLKPNGTIMLDAEQKWTLDMVWEAISALFGDPLGYDTSLKQALLHFAPPLDRGYYLDYPFHKLNGELAVMRIRLFTVLELKTMLRDAAITPTKSYGIHAITNLIPSTVLHATNPSRLTKAAFAVLSRVESRFQGAPPYNYCGNTVVLLGRRGAG